MQKKILFLDGLRGIAAIYVLVGHARWLLWEGYEPGYLSHHIMYSSFDVFLMYFLSIFKFGHEFVLFFFVLSGFVIHMGYAKKLQQNPKTELNFVQYFFKRAKRIYPPFILAILLTTVLDACGKSNDFPIYKGQTAYPLINGNVGNHLTDIYTFLGNTFFLFKEYFPVFGTNGPVWSLKYEWWFYMVYPAFLLLSRKNIYLSTGLILVLFVGSFYPEIWPEQLLRNVFSMMLSWWLGVLLAEITTSRLNVGYNGYSILCVTSFAAMFFLNKNNVLEDLQTAFLFAGLLSLLLWCNTKNISLKFLEKLKPLGDFSYTLYITHFPILVFLSGWIMKYHNNQLPVHSYFVLGGIVICLLFAFLFHFIVEVPFLKSDKKALVKSNA